MLWVVRPGLREKKSSPSGDNTIFILYDYWDATRRIAKGDRKTLCSPPQRRNLRLQQSNRFILFSNSTGTSTRVFSILAFAHSTRRSAATPRSIPVSQNEKFASYLVPFSFENSIKREQHNITPAHREKMCGRFAMLMVPAPVRPSPAAAWPPRRCPGADIAGSFPQAYPPESRSSGSGCTICCLPEAHTRGIPAWRFD